MSDSYATPIRVTHPLPADPTIPLTLEQLAAAFDIAEARRQFMRLYELLAECEAESEMTPEGAVSGN
jgi:hypothetical protein